MRLGIALPLAAGLIISGGAAAPASAAPATVTPRPAVAAQPLTATITVSLDRGDGQPGSATLVRQREMLGREVWAGTLDDDPTSTVVRVRFRGETLTHVTSRYGAYEDSPVKGQLRHVRRNPAERLAEAEPPAHRSRPVRPELKPRTSRFSPAADTPSVTRNAPAPSLAETVDLGTPVGSPYVDEEGYAVQEYSAGITYARDGETLEVGGEVFVEYQALGLAKGILGHPRFGQFVGGNSVTVQSFEKGDIYWRADVGATYVRGASLSLYADHLWESGDLGYPTKGEYVGADGVSRMNDFSRNAVIISNPTTGTHALMGPVLDGWRAAGAEGSFGTPTTEVSASGTGVERADFRTLDDATASIVHTPNAGTFTVAGDIRDRWISFGGAENGPLGGPVAAATSLRAGTTRQMFEHGLMVAREGAGAQPVKGRLLDEYLRRGAEAGEMGAPTGAEIQMEGGWLQTFEHGDLYFYNDGTYKWSPATTDPAVPVVDVLWAYTQAAQNALGSETDVTNRIVLGAAVTNDGAAESGAHFRVRIVGIKKTADQETGDMVSSLNSLQGMADGRFDDVSVERERLRADLVQMLTMDRGDYCGVGNANPGLEDYDAFSIAKADCTQSGGVVMHELGHTMGLNHDHVTDGPDGGPGYNYGHYDLIGRFRTVMTYDKPCTLAGVTCTYLLRYSNPNQRYAGRPLGVPAGRANASDEVRWLNENIGKVASFR